MLLVVKCSGNCAYVAFANWQNVLGKHLFDEQFTILSFVSRGRPVDGRVPGKSDCLSARFVICRLVLEHDVNVMQTEVRSISPAPETQQFIFVLFYRQKCDFC